MTELEILRGLLDGLCKAINKLGCEYFNTHELKPIPLDLLAIAGNYGDTMTDEELLKQLKAYNETGSIFDQIICSVDEDDVTPTH